VAVITNWPIQLINEFVVIAGVFRVTLLKRLETEMFIPLLDIYLNSGLASF
jgi:hypothetical protein